MSHTEVYFRPHSKNIATPLRVGHVFETPNILIQAIRQDEESTSNQRRDEINKGRYHLIAGLYDNGRRLGDFKLVMSGEEEKKYFDNINRLPEVVTVSPYEAKSISELRSSTSLTNLLQDRANSDATITPEFIRDHLHPKLKKGELKTGDDLSRLFEQLAVDKVTNEKDAEITELQGIIDSLRGAQAGNSDPASGVHHPMDLPAETVTPEWNSKTGSAYVNVGLNAYINDVSKNGDVIELQFINADGSLETIKDFGYHGLVQPVYDYLKAKEKSRCVFIVTWKTGTAKRRLASDTMNLPQYQDLWG